MTPDFTIAIDDALVARYPRCIDCGHVAQRCAAFLVGGLVMAISRCAPCFAKDREGAHLLARLARRDGNPNSGLVTEPDGNPNDVTIQHSEDRLA
jgi:hypothetical protein